VARREGLRIPETSSDAKTRVPLGGELRNSLLHPEVGTLIMLCISIALGLSISPYFADIGFLLDSTTAFAEFGIVALWLTFVIIGGQIDLSVASIMALVSCVVASLYRYQGLDMAIALPIGIALGFLLGVINGLLVTRFKLPSIIVTIGTLALYSGIAQILLGDYSIGKFPRWFAGIDQKTLWGIPIPLLIFIVLMIIAALILKRSIFGRQVYAIGTNEKAALFSGIPVNRVKLLLFTISGGVSALAGLMMMSRLAVARYDMASGGALDIVTIALLGGTDINGGSGNVIGTFIAFFVIVSLRTGMTVANVKIEAQLTILGSLLILAIVISNFIYSKRR
jgi:rhamnose transport system permease protein